MPASSSLRASLGAALALLALSTTACAPGASARPAHTTSAAVSPHQGLTIDQMRTREAAAPLSDFRIRAADGAIELHVKASAAPTLKNKRQRDGTAYSVVSFPIGGETDAVCQAIASPLDMAHWVEGFLAEVRATLTEPPTVEVEVVDGHPLFLVHTEAIIDDDGVKKRHIAKFAAAHLDRGSVACIHDGVGYEATFRDVARHVVHASTTPDAEQPLFRSIAVSRDGDRVLGFEEARVYPGRVSGESRQTSLATAILVREGGWTTADSGWVGIVDAKGVVSERALRRLGKQTVFDMSLTRKSAGVYGYQGTVGGEPKQGTFTAREPLVTHLSGAKAIAAFARDGARKELALLHFDEAVPAAAVREVYKHEGKDQLGVEDRGRSYHCVADGRGLCTKMWRADESWSLERVYTSGSL